MPYVGGVAYQPVVIEIGDIEIGAVEIKDQTGTRRASVVNSGGQDRLAVDAWVSGGSFSIPQLQSIERALAAMAAGTWTGATHDCYTYAGFGVSVYLARIAADTTVDVDIETSDDGVTWRRQDRQRLVIDAGHTTVNYNRVYSPTRRYMRVQLTNNTAAVNAEVVTLLKPIP